MFLLLVDFVLGLFPQWKNHDVAKKIRKLANPSCELVRKFLPADLPVDFSHFVVILGLLILMKLW